MGVLLATAIEQFCKRPQAGGMSCWFTACASIHNCRLTVPCEGRTSTYTHILATRSAQISTGLTAYIKACLKHQIDLPVLSAAAQADGMIPESSFCPLLPLDGPFIINCIVIAQ